MILWTINQHVRSNLAIQSRPQNQLRTVQCTTYLSNRPAERALSMANIHQHSTLVCFYDVSIQVHVAMRYTTFLGQLCCVDYRTLVRMEHVSVDVTRAQAVVIKRRKCNDAAVDVFDNSYTSKFHQG